MGGWQILSAHRECDVGRTVKWAAQRCVVSRARRLWQRPCCLSFCSLIRARTAVVSVESRDGRRVSRRRPGPAVRTVHQPRRPGAWPGAISAALNPPTGTQDEGHEEGERRPDGQHRNSVCPSRPIPGSDRRAADRERRYDRAVSRCRYVVGIEATGPNRSCRSVSTPPPPAALARAARTPPKCSPSIRSSTRSPAAAPDPGLGPPRPTPPSWRTEGSHTWGPRRRWSRAIAGLGRGGLPPPPSSGLALSRTGVLAWMDGGWMSSRRGVPLQDGLVFWGSRTQPAVSTGPPPMALLGNSS